MAKISLRKQNFGTSFDVVEDVEGIVYKVEAGDPLTTPHTNFLDLQKSIDGFLVINKKGFTDVYINIVDSETFQIIRSVDIEVEILIF